MVADRADSAEQLHPAAAAAYNAGDLDGMLAL